MATNWNLRSNFSVNKMDHANFTVLEHLAVDHIACEDRSLVLRYQHLSFSQGSDRYDRGELLLRPMFEVDISRTEEAQLLCEFRAVW